MFHIKVDKNVENILWSDH